MYKAILFDLDGVIFDTEPQYSVFWDSQFKIYYPQTNGLAQVIKGQTLTQIYDKYFADKRDEQAEITQRLYEFEANMSFEYIAGFEDFIADVLHNGIKTAVVTSSNNAKMANVYANHPEFKALFDRVLTSEDISKSKPDPECYLKAAEYLGLQPSECIGFEDSINGLKSVHAAGMKVVGLSTTNTEETILPLSNTVINDYIGMTYDKICKSID